MPCFVYGHVVVYSVNFVFGLQHAILPFGKVLGKLSRIYSVIPTNLSTGLPDLLKMADQKPRQRVTQTTVREDIKLPSDPVKAKAGASGTTAEMMDKKAYKYVKAPESWKIAFKYGLPAGAALIFALSVFMGWYDWNTWKGMWGWFFRMIKAIFVWEDY